jgi:hypothetical protein
MAEDISFADQCRLTWLKAGRAPLKYLFILSHMRSGSTLLVHILSSNPDVAGFGETILKYESPADLDRLLLKVADFFEQKRLPQKFVLDKLLQDDLLRDESILQRPDVHTIFLLRRPEKSLPSILNVYANVYPKVAPHLAGGEKEAVDYYNGRLATLARLAKQLNDKERTLFLTHEQTLLDTPAVFAALKDSLKVSQPFTENYKTHEATGKPVTGDFSDTIKKGHIVRDDKHVYADLSVSAMQEAIEAYENCVAELAKYCATASKEHHSVKAH